MKVLLVDPQRHGALDKSRLESEFLVVDTAFSKMAAAKLLAKNSYAAAILVSGDCAKSTISLAFWIRSINASIPLLAVCDALETEPCVSLLSVCDDVVTHPARIPEIAARLRALTRRGEVKRTNELSAGTLKLDLDRRTVTLGGKLLQLRYKEFALLEYFMTHPGMVVSRETLLEHVWDMNTNPFTNTVDVHVTLLRRKLHSKRRSFIHTVPKQGYRFEANG